MKGGKSKWEREREREKKIHAHMHTQNKTNKRKLAKRDFRSHTHIQLPSHAAYIFCLIVLPNFAILFVTMVFSSFFSSFNPSENLFSSFEHFI